MIRLQKIGLRNKGEFGITPSPLSGVSACFGLICLIR
jgi:hypothetical protein